jgi:PilZ domain
MARWTSSTAFKELAATANGRRVRERIPLDRMPETHRALRHPFVAGVHITDLQTETKLAAHTEDISAYGCFIETIEPLAADTRIRVQITRNGQHMVAHGKVAYSRPKAGMGVVFVSFEPGSLATLNKWLDDLRT